MVDEDGRASWRSGQGSGLTGLAERATALAGTVTHQRTPDGRFRLLLQVPQEVR
jgi:signal transduction histidine kinase